VISRDSLIRRLASLIAHCSSLIALLCASCGAQRFYEGAKLPPEEVAVIHVGDTIVLAVDGTRRLGGYLGRPRIEVLPGQHALTLAFEEPAGVVGTKETPAMRGEGVCILEIDAKMGGQYWLGARAVGEEWTGIRWEGKWRAWARDPSVSDEDDIIARCESQPEPEETKETPAPVATPEAADKGEPIPVAAPVSPPTSEPRPAAAREMQTSVHPSAGFAAGLDAAVWLVRSHDNHRVVVRRLCGASRCWTESYLQSLVPRHVVSEGVEHVIMEEKTTVQVKEATSVSSFVEEVNIVDHEGSFAFELRISDTKDPGAGPARLLVFPLPAGDYRAMQLAVDR
jgi:hypothetical protein